MNLFYLVMLFQDEVDPETVEFLEGLIETNELKSAIVRRASADASILFEWISRIPRYYRLKESIPPHAWEQLKEFVASICFSSFIYMFIRSAILSRPKWRRKRKLPPRLRNQISTMLNKHSMRTYIRQCSCYNF